MVKQPRLLLIGLTLMVALFAFARSVAAADKLSQALTDLQILYLYEDPETIDWPTLYYLNDAHGCRIDLLTVSSSHGYYYQSREVRDRSIYLHHFYVNPDDRSLLDSLLANQFATRQPDIIIFGASQFGPLVTSLAERLETLEPAENSIFGIRKRFRSVSPLEGGRPASGATVTLGRRELIERYRDRMKLEIPELFAWMTVEHLSDTRLARYQTVGSTPPASEQPQPDFLSGLPSLRLLPLLDTVLSDGAVKRAFIERAREYITFFDAARNSVATRKAENVITGYKSLLTLVDQVRLAPELQALEDFRPYLNRLVARAQAAVLQVIGMDWEGKIILRDSPHGPKLKFRVAVSVNGPRPIELSYIRFEPYWDTIATVLESTSRAIAPHQSFVREYLVDIGRERLEATMPESLIFSAEIVYGVTPLTVRSAMPIWERPDLQIEFHPSFFFVPPVAQVDVDKVVKSMNWKAVITKPLYYHGTVTLNLKTPRGIFAGAYRQKWVLEKGRATETVRIPFSVSNLFELGVQRQSITLAVDDRVVASDTGIIRIASCQVDDKVAIGLMPDSTGLLEDILHMTGVTYQPLTDRTLKTGDLDAYTVILVGSGAVRDYPSFRLIKGRLEEYMRQGGSLVLFGQPTDWPEGTLPVSFVPSVEHLTGSMLLNRIPNARLTSRPYSISEGNLLAWMEIRRKVGAAVISPAEKVYVSPSGATLLSVSRLGDGQLIFCGLPLIEMISQLNIEAIHLLANILNY